MSDPARWTRVDGIRDAVRRRWNDGTLPRAYAVGDPFPPIEVPLRHPSAADVAEHFDAARAWADAVTRGSADGAAYDLAHGRIGGRAAGSTAVPTRAVVSTYAQAWKLLGSGSGSGAGVGAGVAAQAEALRRIVAMSEGGPERESGRSEGAGPDLDARGRGPGARGRGTGSDPRARAWALAHPAKAIALAGRWPQLLAALAWLRAQRGSGRYLREVDAPGVDTKLIEQHRAVLADILEVPASAAAFTAALGLAAKPATVRLRFDPAVLGLPAGLTEASLRADELGRLPASPSRVLIVENEITYLTVPIPPGRVVLWGRGYDAAEPASLAWLRDAPVLYWGDLDTHGFAILDRVRAHLPQARSLLMDRETLLAHQERWGTEPSPTAARLPRLDAAEQAVYDDLVTDRLGPAVRLEQERIDWAWARQALAWEGFA